MYDKENKYVHKCHVCKKNFYVVNIHDYQWKFNNKLCCSYTCMRKLEQPYIKKLKNKIKE